MDPVSTWGGKQGWGSIGPYHRKWLWVDPLRIECPLKSVLHLCSSYLLTSSFGTLWFSHFSQTPFPYYPLSTWGGKQGWWTLDPPIGPHPKTRPSPNSKPFQIHTEDTSLFLILHSFQLWHFSKFRKVHSHSKLDPLSVDHQPTESLGPQEGTIGRVYNFDLVQIQNPYKFQLRTLPSY